MAEWLRKAWNSEYQDKVVVTYPFLLYIALFLILSTFYEEVHNQGLVIYIYIYIYIYIHMYLCNNENNVPSSLWRQWLYGISCTWAHDAPKCICCHKALVVIIGRAQCFHYYIYITPILLLWDFSTLCVMDHLWTLVYIYIHTYKIYI